MGDDDWVDADVVLMWQFVAMFDHVFDCILVKQR
jgi:hypothetical protein